MLSLILFLGILRIFNWTQLIGTIAEPSENTVEMAPVVTDNPYINDLEKVITLIENIAASAQKSFEEDIEPTDKIADVFDKIVKSLGDLGEIMKDNHLSYEFLKANGINRIILKNLHISFPKLRAQLLLLLRDLFKADPDTTKSVIPIKIIDQLLDIFEIEEEFEFKKHVIDIFKLWLPRNPKVQARIIRLKGLQHFYNQMITLGIPAVHDLLVLFNIIIDEHLDVRSNKSIPKDPHDLLLYQRIGLIERLSTATICNGLLEIFRLSWVSNDRKVLNPVFDLVVKIKPYCINRYLRKQKAEDLFKAFLNYVKENKNETLEKYNITVVKIEEELTDYVNKLKGAGKDEF